MYSFCIKYTDKTKIIMIQRSTGYSDRRALTVDEMKDAIEAIKKFNQDIIIMVIEFN